MRSAGKDEVEGEKLEEEEGEKLEEEEEEEEGLTPPSARAPRSASRQGATRPIRRATSGC